MGCVVNSLGTSAVYDLNLDIRIIIPFNNMKTHGPRDK